MSKGIELSPKYGVNPTIPVCFWCGKEKNQIALLGRMRKKETTRTAYGTTHTRVAGDYEAPMRMVLDYEPCDECAKAFSQGVQVIEVVSGACIDDERPALTKDENGHKAYPTGRTLCIRPEAAQQIFTIDKSMLEAGKKLCLDSGIFNQLLEMIGQPTNI